MKGLASIAIIGVLSLVTAGALLLSGGLNTQRFVNVTSPASRIGNMSALNLDTGEHVPLNADPRAIKNFMDSPGQKAFVSTENETLLSRIEKDNVVDPQVLASQRTVKMEYDAETGQKIVVPYNYDSKELRQIAENEDVLAAIREQPQVDLSKYSLLNVNSGEYIRLDSGDELVKAFQSSATEKKESTAIVRSTDPKTLDLLSHSYDLRQQVEQMKSSDISESIKRKGFVGTDSVTGESFFTGPPEMLGDLNLVSSGALNPAVEDSLSGVEAVAQAREEELASSVNKGLNLQGMVEGAIQNLMWAGLISALLFVVWKFILPYVISYISKRGQEVRHTKEVEKTRAPGATVTKGESAARGASTLESVLVVKPTDTLVETGSEQSIELAISNISPENLKDVEVTTPAASNYIGNLNAGEETSARIEIGSVNSQSKNVKVTVNFAPVKIGGRTFRRHDFTIPLKIVKVAEEEEAPEAEAGTESENCAFHPKEEAVAKCVKCGKLLCEDCAKEKDGKIYCPAHSK